MCGIVGISSQEPVAPFLHDSLIHLQHRGQDAAGILTANNRFYSKHGLGLVREIFTGSDIDTLQGNMGIAHVRYPTSGGHSKTDVQPLWTGSPRGIALAHNGNLINYPALFESFRNQYRHLNSALDSEALLMLLADQLAAPPFLEEDDLFFQKLCQAIQIIHQKVEGAYSIVGLIMGKGLVAFRDPHGIRPLVWGERLCSTGISDYIFASETTPFYALGFTPKGDLQPGEIAFVNQAGKLFRRTLSQKTFRPCAFEYIYFARPDAVLDGVSVYRARLRMGQNLARHWQRRYPNELPDVVVPAPFTANTAALSFAHELGVRYSEGLYKNPFIGRTFIMPDQEIRSRNVRYKLTPQRIELENKKVLIVDDSIVRGTTSQEIVRMVRECHAKEIYFASTCPPVSHPCFYGIDLPSQQELLAATRTHSQIREYLGVDRLLFQTEAGLIEAITRKGKHLIKKPCMGCMDGEYVCGKMDAKELERLETIRKKGLSS